jgi:hypothetical protein
MFHHFSGYGRTVGERALLGHVGSSGASLCIETPESRRDRGSVNAIELFQERVARCLASKESGVHEPVSVEMRRPSGAVRLTQNKRRGSRLTGR